MLKRHSKGLTRALISTIEPVDGGVPSMTWWICKILQERGIIPILAWYAPWSNSPEDSVRMHELFMKKPQKKKRSLKGVYEGWGIGCWCPEFEFGHFLPSCHWRELIEYTQLHITVSGNVLAASPYFYMKVPFLAWLATPWEADRKDRVRKFHLSRRVFDGIINKPVSKRLERHILRSPQGHFLSLSNYTSKEISKISGKGLSDVMFMPVDGNFFYEDSSQVVKWRIGFSGRYCDPRKNIALLLHATRILINQGYPIQLILVGDRNPSLINDLLSEFDLHQIIECYSQQDKEGLGKHLRSFDLFVIPSYQEGLCISAIEAMACGAPVISTRCGGPEDYVLNNETGFLIDSQPEALANQIIEVCSSRSNRERLSSNAVKWVSENASEKVSRMIFYDSLDKLEQRYKNYSLCTKFY